MVALGGVSGLGGWAESPNLPHVYKVTTLSCRSLRVHNISSGPELGSTSLFGFLKGPPDPCPGQWGHRSTCLLLGPHTRATFLGHQSCPGSGLYGDCGSLPSSLLPEGCPLGTFGSRSCVDPIASPHSHKCHMTCQVSQRPSTAPPALPRQLLYPKKRRSMPCTAEPSASGAVSVICQAAGMGLWGQHMHGCWVWTLRGTELLLREADLTSAPLSVGSPRAWLITAPVAPGGLFVPAMLLETPARVLGDKA